MRKLIFIIAGGLLVIVGITGLMIALKEALTVGGLLPFLAILFVGITYMWFSREKIELINIPLYLSAWSVLSAVILSTISISLMILGYADPFALIFGGSGRAGGLDSLATFVLVGLIPLNMIFSVIAYMIGFLKYVDIRLHPPTQQQIISPKPNFKRKLSI